MEIFYAADDILIRGKHINSTIISSRADFHRGDILMPHRSVSAVVTARLVRRPSLPITHTGDATPLSHCLVVVDELVSCSWHAGRRHLFNVDLCSETEQYRSGRRVNKWRRACVV